MKKMIISIAIFIQIALNYSIAQLSIPDVINVGDCPLSIYVNFNSEYFNSKNIYYPIENVINEDIFILGGSIIDNNPKFKNTIQPNSVPLGKIMPNEIFFASFGITIAQIDSISLSGGYLSFTNRIYYKIKSKNDIDSVDMIIKYRAIDTNAIIAVDYYYFEKDRKKD